MAKKHNENTGFVKKLLADARAVGVARPVFVLADVESYSMRCTLEDYFPQILGGPSTEPLFITVWAKEKLIQVMRDNRGLGNQAMANTLEEATDECVCWVLSLAEAYMILDGYRKGLTRNSLRHRTESSAFYDGLPNQVCRCCAHKVRPLRVHVRLDNGTSIHVRGDTPEQAVRAATLTQIAGNRRLPTLMLRHDDSAADRVDLPLRDAELSAILGDCYGRDGQLVAGVIGRLKEAGDVGHEWITEVMTEYPDLNPLAEQVRSLLTQKNERPHDSM